MKNRRESTLLDSSLKSKYLKKELKEKRYNIKLIDCGNFIRIYKFQNDKFKIDSSFKKERNIKKIDTDTLVKKSNLSKYKSINILNAIRSNNSIQCLARANSSSWNTFITLTFKDNVTDISYANKKFNQFISNVRKLKKDFKYLAVPEFQKRGAVHYHLLSNLNYDDGVIIPQKNKKGNAINIDSLYDVKYWSFGFCRVDFIKNNYKKIFSYLTKYMTKDIDDRLFSKKRYLFSQNLNRPIINYCNETDLNFIYDKISDKVIDFESEYLDKYTNTIIKFIEFKKD